MSYCRFTSYLPPRVNMLCYASVFEGYIVTHDDYLSNYTLQFRTYFIKNILIKSVQS